jgi:hypothetical protein
MRTTGKLRTRSRGISATDFNAASERCPSTYHFIHREYREGPLLASGSLDGDYFLISATSTFSVAASDVDTG